MLFIYKLHKVLPVYPSIESLNAVLYMLDNKMITGIQGQPLLEQICNIDAPNAETEVLVDYYNNLLDSLGTLEIMRTFGYEQVFTFRMSFFELSVDYFGKILNLSDKNSALRTNATRDLIETFHPRSLFYMATQAYKYWHTDTPLAQSFLDKIEHLTQLKIGFKEKGNDFKYDYQAGASEKMRLQYLLYWSKHYHDFDWDPYNGYFTNKYTAEEITQNYERLFRRLNSKNDSVALKSFLLLTEGSPTDVIELAEKYKQLLRTYNSSLPSFKHAYLEQLAQLTDYCRRNGFSYKASKPLEKTLQKLLIIDAPHDRYQLENHLINNLTLRDISAVEYWACIYENSSEFSFSVGRILDRYYSKNWEKIIRDEAQLLLYLKKSQLFEDIGVFGSCNNYLVKFDVNDPQLQAKLSTLLKIETDEGIISQISRLIVLPEEAEDNSALDINEFLNDANIFTKRDIKILPPPSPSETKKIVKAIKDAEEMASIRQYFHYLRLNPSIEMVPQLFALVEDKRIVTQRNGAIIRVADLIVPSLEGIYNYHFEPEDELKPFATAQWKRLWKEDGKNYRHWIKRFFEQKLDSLKMAEELVIEDINLITESPHFTASYKAVCLESLPKVRPFKEIRKLNIDPKLNVRTDLKYFQGFFFSYKELDDIPKLFNIPHIDAMVMLDYLEKKSAEFSISERGSFYNNLFRSAWFSSYINSKDADKEVAERIKEVLSTYLDESDYLSEFEEQITNLHIAQIDNIGRSLEEKLQASIQIEADPGSKAKIQESIIAGISFQDLGVAVENLAQYDGPNANQALSFLYKDFGLPVFSLDQSKDLLEFLEKHGKLSEYDFYYHYLQKFDVRFTKGRAQLDFEKIYNILRFDIISPFVSRTGGKRDYYTYGIIKLLELHFKTRLGFHEKLNENQTFYTFSSLKRASAWLKYLEDNKFVNHRNQSPPSFSQVRKND